MKMSKKHLEDHSEGNRDRGYSHCRGTGSESHDTVKGKPATPMR